MKLAGPEPASPATDGPPMDMPPVDAGLESQPTSDDKPFDAEPFDAGVEADEQSDPKKFIEQLTGKLGQSLRKYNEEQGQPDFELEKFAINSLLSATHTSEMDNNDQEDIIKKVKEAGNDEEPNGSEEDKSEESDVDSSTADSTTGDFGSASPEGGEAAPADNAPVAEGKTQVELDNPTLYPDGWKEMDGLFMNPKKNNMFQDGSNDILKNNLKESEKSSIFDKNKIKSKLHETFNQEDAMSEPMTEPVVKPSEPAPLKTPNTEPPTIAPSRKNKPFLPMPSVKPDPKASK